MGEGECNSLLTMGKNKAFFIFLIIVGGISLGVFCFFKDGGYRNFLKNEDCFTIEEMTVNGYSMYPLIKPEERVDGLFGYYNCHEINRNDIVIFNYSGNKNMIIKSVKAIPGDKWSIEEIDGYYQIFVNDSPLKNSEGNDYKLSEASSRVLKIYINDYPIIPKDAYLLLGDEIGGSLDSTRFGLAGKLDIKAKVIIK